MTNEEFDLLVFHNCAGKCDCAECERIRAFVSVRKTDNSTLRNRDTPEYKRYWKTEMQEDESSW